MRLGKIALFVSAVLLLALVQLIAVVKFQVPVPHYFVSKTQDVLATIDQQIHQTPRIPRILHQIWISRKGDGSDHPLPVMISRFAADMKKVHEELGWTYHLWRDELYEMYKDDPYVGRYRQSNLGTETVALLVDRLRLLVLRDYGGVFCDIDAKIVRPFEVLIQKIPFQTTFFAGIRRIEDNDHMVEVAVLGSAPRSRVIMGTLNEYAPVTNALTGFPGGGMVARWMAFFFDENTIIFNYHHFYSTVLNNETIVLQDQYQLGSWRSSIGTAFRDVWRTDTKEAVLTILSTCFEIFRQSKVPSWLGAGALMGFTRNGTLHPWDDIVDINFEQNTISNAVEMLLRERLTAVGMELYPFWGGYKVFPSNKPKIEKYAWAYPFVDLRWYTVAANRTQIEYDKKIYPIASIYPTQTTVFEGIFVDVPADPRAVVSILYDEDWEIVCKSRHWEREFEKNLHPLTIGCDQVASKHPFNKGPASRHNMRVKQARQAFLPIWDEGTEAKIYDLMETTLQLCDAVGIPTWIGGTTLLGYARNGTIHPWDDAVDIMIERALPTSNVITLTTLEAKLTPLGYKIVEYWGGFKIFPAAAKPLPGFNYGYPAIDLRWYHLDSVDGKTVVKASHGVTVPQEWIFPLKPRKLRSTQITKPNSNRDLWGWVTKTRRPDLRTINVKVPNNVKGALSIWFGDDYMKTCKSRSWDRTLEHPLTMETLPCEDISDLYTFQPAED
jgi:hypothetical protein